MNALLQQYIPVTIKVGLLLVLFMPLVVSGGVIFPYIVPKAIFMWFVVDILFVLWVVLLLYCPEYRLKMSWLLILVFAYLAIMLLSAVFGINFTQSIWGTYERMTGVFNSVHVFLYALMLTSVMRNKSDWVWVLGVSVGVSVASGIIGLREEYINGRSIAYIGNALFNGSYILMSIFIGIALIALVYQAKIKNIIYVVIIYGAVVFNIYSLWITGTRSAMLALFISLILLTVICFLYYRKHACTYIFASLLLLYVSLIGIMVLLSTTSDTYSDTMVSRVQAGVSENRDQSVNERQYMLFKSIDIIKDKPLLGWGDGNIGNAFKIHNEYDEIGIVNRPKDIDNTHTAYLQNAIAHGIIGGIVYLCIWLVMLIVTAKLVMQTKLLYYIAILISIIAYMIMNLFMVDSPVHLLSFAVLLGMVVSLSNNINMHIPSIKIAFNTQLVKIIKIGLLVVAIIVTVWSAANVYGIARDSAYDDILVLEDIYSTSLDNSRMDMWYKEAVVETLTENIDSITEGQLHEYINSIEYLDYRGEVTDKNYGYAVQLALFYIQASKIDINYIDRAVHYVSMLENKYPNSAYTKNARERLNKLVE